jgi:iron complex transport system permease protein
MKKGLISGSIIIACIAAFIISLCAGGGKFSALPLITLLKGGHSPETAVLLYMRLPRLFAALITGSALAVSGTLLQSLVKSPLADPYTLGVSGGASLGAAAAIILMLPYPAVACIALTGAAAAVTVVFLLSRSFSAGENTVILAGIGINILTSSAVMMLFALAESHRVHKALLWLMGDLSLARYDALVPAAGAVVLLITASFRYAPHLNLLSYGSDYAKAAGVSIIDIRAIFILASFLAAISVSLAGVIGFVGLLAPHIVRKLVSSHDNRIVLPLSAVLGGTVLALCDTIGRAAAYPFELPCGVVTGFCGGAALIVLLFTGKKE